MAWNAGVDSNGESSNVCSRAEMRENRDTCYEAVVLSISQCLVPWDQKWCWNSVHSPL